MSVSTTAGSWAYQQPVGGQSLGQECHIASYQITAPVNATGPTGFSVTIPGLRLAGTRIIGLVPTSSTAGALANKYAAVSAADTLTIYHTGANLAGSETFDCTIMTQN